MLVIKVIKLLKIKIIKNNQSLSHLLVPLFQIRKARHYRTEGSSLVSKLSCQLLSVREFNGVLELYIYIGIIAMFDCYTFRCVV